MRSLATARFCLAAATAAALGAQTDPVLRVSPAVRPGGVIAFAITDRPGTPVLTLLDLDGGPRIALGGELFLGLRDTTVLGLDVLGPTGTLTRALPIPAFVPGGWVLYSQAIALNGGLRRSDGESTAVHRSRAALVQDFDDTAAQGLTGDYDAGVRGRAQAAPVSVRTQDLIPQQGVQYPGSVFGVVNGVFGSRCQAVYRASDLGASGRAEWLTAVRWLPTAQFPMSRETGIGLDVRASHSTVVPDFTLDPFTALAMFPLSGLVATFVQNVKAGEQPEPLIRATYDIDPAKRRADGFVPFPPVRRPFRYNGVDSLLLDFRTVGGQGLNAVQIALMLQSGPLPAARAIASGTAAQPIDPNTPTTATILDNSFYELQVDLARADSEAVSAWLAAPIANPDYRTPLVSQSVPLGAALRVEFRGSTSATGSNPTEWSDDIDAIDGLPFLQYRLRFEAAPFGRLLPSVDQVVIPID